MEKGYIDVLNSSVFLFAMYSVTCTGCRAVRLGLGSPLAVGPQERDYSAGVTVGKEKVWMIQASPTCLYFPFPPGYPDRVVPLLYGLAATGQGAPASC